MIPDTPPPPRRVVTVAATQFPITNSPARNRLLAESVVRLAATEGGARIVLLPELFDDLYFCQDQNVDNFSLSRPIRDDPPPAAEGDDPLLSRFRDLSAELGAVLPISFFERCGAAHYNSVAVFDCGRYLGIYRKSHIPGRGTSVRHRSFAPNLFHLGRCADIVIRSLDHVVSNAAAQLPRSFIFASSFPRPSARLHVS